MNLYKGNRRDDWRTDPELWNALDELYGFTIDLAANAKNAKCKRFIDDKRDALALDWANEIGNGCGWLNPPFSKATPFFEHCGDASLVAIYKASNLETSVWQDLILPLADWVFFLKARVNYLDHKGKPTKSVPFGSALIGYRCDFKLQAWAGRVWVAPNRSVDLL